MRWGTLGLVLVLICALTVPAFAGDDAARYGYVTVQSVSVNLVEEHAVITVDYTIDGGISLLVFLLGQSDLKKKVLQVTDFEKARIQRIDLERAVIIVSNASYDYGGDAYWFPPHTFNVEVPSLTITTPQETRHYEKVRAVPNGVGYFTAP